MRKTERETEREGGRFFMSYDKVCCVGHGRFKRLFFQFSNLPNKQFIDVFFTFKSTYLFKFKTSYIRVKTFLGDFLYVFYFFSYAGF